MGTQELPEFPRSAGKSPKTGAGLRFRGSFPCLWLPKKCKSLVSFKERVGNNRSFKEEKVGISQEKRERGFILGAGVGSSHTWRCLRHRLGGGDGDQKNPKILIREVFRVKRGIPPQLEALFSSVKNSQLPSEAGNLGIWGGRDGSRRRIGKGFPSHPNVAPVRNHGTVGLGSDL